MLILLPASDAKAPVTDGDPVDVDDLSFPPLGPTRTAVLAALVDVSAQPDAWARLGVRETQLDLVRGNVALRDAASAPVERVYAGVLYDAVGLTDLDAAARRRARTWIVIVSALWGALRPGDRIPSYRLDMCGRLPGLAHLTDVWRDPLDEVLPAAARRGVVVDARSSEYLTAWRPHGALAERTVVLRVVRDLAGGRGAGSHRAKWTRGRVVRRILSDAIDPRTPEALAETLAAHFDVDLEPPRRAGQARELRIVEQLG